MSPRTTSPSKNYPIVYTDERCDLPLPPELDLYDPRDRQIDRMRQEIDIHEQSLEPRPVDLW